MRIARVRKMLVSWQLPVRATAAAVLSLAIAGALGLPGPLYAFIAAVIVTDINPAASRLLGTRRIFATVIGAGCGAALSYVVPSGALGVGAGILAAMLLAQALKAGEGVKVAGYISGIVLLEHSSEPLFHALVRFIETVVGVSVAWVISYVPKLIRQKDDEDHPARDNVR